ncbi:MAG: copper-binding protein [Proteobacteria bacterium]|nr:copper-binding protein [Pseudomonadota bacterium]
MKTAIASFCVALATISSASVLAADEHAGHGAMHAASPADAAMSDGLVKKIDKSGGKLTIAHGPLANLGMPAMTMVFRVKDPAWLDQIKDGDKLRFLADTVNGSLTVVKFDKVK